MVTSLFEQNWLGLAQSGRARLKLPPMPIGRGNHRTAAKIPRIDRGGASPGIVGAPPASDEYFQHLSGAYRSAALVGIEAVVLRSHVDATDVHVEVAGGSGRGCPRTPAGASERSVRTGPFLRFTNKRRSLGRCSVMQTEGRKSATSLPERARREMSSYLTGHQRAGPAEPCIPHSFAVRCRNHTSSHDARVKVAWPRRGGLVTRTAVAYRRARFP
jgi:hypothetical protein